MSNESEKLKKSAILTYLKYIYAPGNLTRNKLILTKSAAKKAEVGANSCVKPEEIKPAKIRLKPQNVISVAKGTINKLAITVMGEKILK